MKASIDIRQLAHTVFENARQFCQKNGVMVRACFLLRASGELTALPIDGADPEEKELHWQALHQTALQSDPVAIFTLRDSRYRCYPREDPARPGQDDTVPEGWIADGKLHQCLNMRIEVPGERAIRFAVPYHRNENGTIAFGEPSEGAEDFTGPAPASWASDDSLKN